MTDPQEIIRQLGLQPHPEGGYYRETYQATLRVRHPDLPAGVAAERAAGTAIYFLLPAPDFSAFHRVRSDETWHHYAGDPLELHLLPPTGGHECRILTANLDGGEPQITVPAGWWQAARLAAGGKWSLAGCTVAPGFDFADFELPPAADIIRAHPAHAALIRELTKR
jgi:predicted cupin superfamily sugar epimerase